MEEPRSFLGTGWSFPPPFSKPAGGVVMISDETDIKNSMEVLLSTRVGERILQPKYGCNLDEILFEPLTVSLQTYIKDLVFTAIYYFEPRIKPETVTLIPSAEEGLVIVSVDYMIRATNTRHNLVYPFYLNEGTNIQP